MMNGIMTPFIVWFSIITSNLFVLIIFITRIYYLDNYTRIILLVLWLIMNILFYRNIKDYQRKIEELEELYDK